MAAQRSNLIGNLAQRNPERALSMLVGADPQGLGWHARAHLARQLGEAGQRDRGLQIVRESIQSFRQAPKLDERQINEFVNLLGQTSWYYPEAMREVASALAERLQDPRSLSLSRHTQLQTDQGQIELAPSESAALDFVRRLHNRPQTATEFLAQFPQLKAKLDGVGGLDAVLSPRFRSSRSLPSGGTSIVVSMQGPPGRGRVGLDDSAGAGAQIALEIRKDLTANRSAVGSRLNEVATQGDFNALIRLVQEFAGQNDYELTIYTLELARLIIPQLADLQKQQQSLLTLLQTHQSVEGEAPKSLIEEAFVLGKQLEAEQEKRVPTVPVADGSRRAISPADNYYLQLYGYAFRGDPDGTIKRIRAVPDDERKLTILGHVLQTFMRPNY